MKATRIEAYAKVNLTLEVFGKRVDGYHALRSVVMPVSLADTLEVEEAESGFESDTGYADDLCLKAARALSARFPGRVRGVRIRVAKRIPAGGGLGGGSADAAAVLWALDEMLGLGLPADELARVGADVGSDVPALVLSRACGPVLMEGRGELVKPLFGGGGVRRLHLVLVNPGVFSSTAEVYRECSPRLSDDPSILYNIRKSLADGDIRALAASLVNDLEPPAMRLHPEIESVKRELVAAGAAGALMSGSGSTVFGLVPDEAQGREVAALLGEKGLMAWTAESVCPVV